MGVVVAIPTLPPPVPFNDNIPDPSLPESIRELSEPSTHKCIALVPQLFSMRIPLVATSANWLMVNIPFVVICVLNPNAPLFPNLIFSVCVVVPLLVVKNVINDPVDVVFQFSDAVIRIDALFPVRKAEPSWPVVPHMPRMLFNTT